MRLPGGLLVVLPPSSCFHAAKTACASPLLLQEEMFEMNWVEYVRRDTEGSDSDTRRRAACELVKALRERFPTEVGARGRGGAVRGGRAATFSTRTRPSAPPHTHPPTPARARRCQSCSLGMWQACWQSTRPPPPPPGAPRTAPPTLSPRWRCAARPRQRAPQPPTSWSTCRQVRAEACLLVGK